MARPLSIDHDFCIQKLKSAIALSTMLENSDYPHPDSGLAIKSIKAVYATELRRLQSLRSAQPDTLLEYCRRANVTILRMKPFIGLTLRSSNLRNAFEIYFPVKELAWELLGNKPKVILSSEWSYSPFTYPFSPRELSEYIFIGMPASECQNPLIVPLAAHELGHVVWNRKGTVQAFDSEIKNEIYNQYVNHINDFHITFNTKVPRDRLAGDMFAVGSMAQSYVLALRQVEETFCDFLALYVYGRAFLLAFRYLLAPSLGELRNPKYPRINDRAKNLTQAAGILEFSVEDDFVDSFSDQQPTMTKEAAFIQKMADAASKSLVRKLIDLVKDYKGNTKKYQDTNEEQKAILASMRKLVPPANVLSAEAIVNAAWELRLQLEGWDIPGKYTDKDDLRYEKLRILRDLTLKSFEVFEYQRRIKKNATK